MGILFVRIALSKDHPEEVSLGDQRRAVLGEFLRVLGGAFPAHDDILSPGGNRQRHFSEVHALILMRYSGMRVRNCLPSVCFAQLFGGFRRHREPRPAECEYLPRQGAASWKV